MIELTFIQSIYKYSRHPRNLMCSLRIHCPKTDTKTIWRNQNLKVKFLLAVRVQTNLICQEEIIINNNLTNSKVFFCFDQNSSDISDERIIGQKSETTKDIR